MSNYIMILKILKLILLPLETGEHQVLTMTLNATVLFYNYFHALSGNSYFPLINWKFPPYPIHYYMETSTYLLEIYTYQTRNVNLWSVKFFLLSGIFHLLCGISDNFYLQTGKFYLLFSNFHLLSGNVHLSSGNFQLITGKST